MTGNAVALVAPANKARGQIARYLCEGGYDVFECEELAIATRFVGVVIVDEEPNEVMRTHVQSWLRQSKSPRVVVISSKPSSWRTLSLAHSDHLSVLAAPAFSWDVVDALRAPPPTVSRA
jgi:hypothetical protein